MTDIYAEHGHSDRGELTEHWTDAIGQDQNTRYVPVFFTRGNTKSDYWNVKATYIDPSGSKRVYRNSKTDKACMLKSRDRGKAFSIAFRNRNSYQDVLFDIPSGSCKDGLFGINLVPSFSENEFPQLSQQEL